MSTNITKVFERALIDDTDRRVKVTSVVESVLVVTERAPNVTDNFVGQVFETALVVTERADALDGAIISGVRTSALIREEGAPAKASQVTQQLLVVTDPAPPKEAATVTSSRHQVLFVEANAPSQVPKVGQLSLLSVEPPVRVARVGQARHTTLAADLFRGDVLTNVVLSQLFLQTEPKSRDPERCSVMTVYAAHRKLYAHPSTVISDTRVPSAYSQVAQRAPNRDPSTVHSDSRSQTLWNAIAVQSQKINPKDARSQTPARQVFNQSVVQRTMLSPIDVRPTYRLGQVTISNAVGKTYQNGQDIKSLNQLFNVAISTTASVVYQYPPRSLEKMHAMKVETVHKFNDYLDPSDIAFTPFFRVRVLAFSTTHSVDEYEPPNLMRSQERLLGMKQETAHELSMIDPQVVKSQINFNNVKQETAHTNDTYGHPSGIIPGGRLCTLAISNVVGSPNYEILPKSSVYALRVKQETASPGSYQDPLLIKWSAQGYNIQIMCASSVDYKMPELVTPKRRISSSTKVVIPS